MKKLFILFLFTCSFPVTKGAVNIARIEPAFWWVGTNNPELQIMIQ